MKVHVLAVVAVLIIACVVAGQPSGGLPNQPEEQAQSASLSDLPLLGQYAVSAALGKDQSGYHVRSEGTAHRVTNSRHGLVADLGPGGIEVQAGKTRFGLSLKAFGFEGAVKPVAAAGKPVISDNRIEFERGTLTEWYVNGPLGLQQGFTVASAPKGGDGTTLTLTLVLALSGGLRAVADSDGLGLALRDADGVVRLRYAGLTVYDANKRVFPAQLEVAAGEIQIRVDADGVCYPLVIDPVFQTAKLLASDGAADDRFGLSVSISGDTVVVGAVGDDVKGSFSGSAYIFVKPTGGWSTSHIQTAKLLAKDGATDDYFGASVSISGDTVVVGAHTDDDKGFNSGSAYVFVKPTSGWASTLYQSAKLLASDGARGHRLGHSASISGDTVVVGAYGDDDKGPISGSAYVFVKPSGGWASTLYQSAKLLAKDGAAGDWFGAAVSISQDTVVVGAHRDDDRGADSGSGYVFVKPPSGWRGTLNQAAKLLASDGRWNDGLGNSVSVSGDTVVVGAGGDDDKGYNSGAAYVFVKPTGGWSTIQTQTAKLLASDGAAGDHLGLSSASISGDTVVVGAYWDDDMGLKSGSAYIFVKPTSGWASTLYQSAKLLAKDGAASDYFGYSVSISGDTVVVGAWGDDDKGLDSGSAYVCRRTRLAGTGTPRPAGTVALNLTAGDSAGLSYVIGSSLGTGPIKIGNRMLGLGVDKLLEVSVGNVLPATFVGYRGVIGANGQATAKINIPSIPLLVGNKVHTAFVTVDRKAPQGIKSISNTYSFTIVK